MLAAAVLWPCRVARPNVRETLLQKDAQPLARRSEPEAMHAKSGQNSSSCLAASYFNGERLMLIHCGTECSGACISILGLVLLCNPEPEPGRTRWSVKTTRPESLMLTITAPVQQPQTAPHHQEAYVMILLSGGGNLLHLRYIQATAPRLHGVRPVFRPYWTTWTYYQSLLLLAGG